MSSIPLQQDCNPNDPEEAFLWLLMGLPGLEEQAPMLLPPQILRKWSKRLWDGGLRWDPKFQTIKYVPPVGQYHWLAGAGGSWVDIDADLPPEVTAPSLDHLSHAEKQQVVRKLREEGYIPTPEHGPHLDQAGVQNLGD